jgi:hypothetical protein
MLMSLHHNVGQIRNLKIATVTIENMVQYHFKI